MENNILKSKTALRQQLRIRLLAMSPEQRANGSRQAASLLERQAIWQQAQSILFYAPLPGELDLWRLVEDSLAAGKTVALPRFDAATNKYGACRVEDPARDLAPGKFGIREPTNHCAVVPLNRLDLILVPGVAFDGQGHRLGRGKGFYDRLLAVVRGRTCGVAFDEQLVAAIPVEPHDIHLNCLLTPTRWIEP